MIDFLTLANASKAQLVADRRWLHQHPEIRDDLPMTAQYVMDRLRSMGLEPREISKCGITADIRGGKKGRSVLLRADMDALPVKEDSGLPFASTTGYGHCCGHDLHTAMLLTAASMLSAHKDDLHGCVRLMFQPGEEFGIGSQPMIDAGILEGMEAAVDMHVNARNPVGTVAICPGYTCASSDSMKMTITGKGCHGPGPILV